MPDYSAESRKRLDSCCYHITDVFDMVIRYYDCIIIEGRRSPERQADLIRQGKSRTTVEKARHCQSPSQAVDAGPYPIDWNNTKGFYYFAGVVFGVARVMGYHLRWGGDWDGDNDLNDQTFMDLVHFECLECEIESA